MHLKPLVFLSMVVGMLPGTLWCQDSLQSKVLIRMGYGYQTCIFELANRYGSHGTLSLGGTLHHRYWTTGPFLQYVFGSRVKEDVLARLRSPGGELIGEDHQLAVVDLRQRGVLIGWRFGREFQLRNGHYITSSIQPVWMAHWIRFQNTGNTFKPIQGNYKYGYDRMTTGWGAQQSIGYRYQSPGKLINFEISVNLTEASTRLRRNVQFDGSTNGTKRRLDGYTGIEARWILPIYSRPNPDKIYY